MSENKPFPVSVKSEAEMAMAHNEPWYAEPGEPLQGVRDVILVASGKGGVGKSTVTVNLACALQQQGMKVGILDADLYGPSIARMLGTDVALARNKDGQTIPAVAHGVHAVSVANVIPPEAALVWKGPLVSQTLLQMFREVVWPELDVLLVDLPPGTGDVQLTILEQIPVTGVVLVTTPQRLAQVDADRGVALFHELDIPVFGIVENMGHYVCPCCGEMQPLFPDAKVEALAKRRYVGYFGAIPLDPAGQLLADEGRPLVVSDPDGAAGQAFSRLAGKVDEALERERRSRRHNDSPETQAAHQAFWEGLLEE